MPPFDEFAKQLPDLRPADRESATAKRRDPVNAPLPAFASLGSRHQVALPLQSVKYRVHRPGADLVPVSAKFLDDRQAENGAFLGVMENMKADHAAEEILVDHLLRSCGEGQAAERTRMLMRGAASLDGAQEDQWRSIVLRRSRSA